MLNGQDKFLAAGALYLTLHDQIRQTPDDILVDAITALRTVTGKHNGRLAGEMLAVNTLLADLETELDRRSGNR